MVCSITCFLHSKGSDLYNGIKWSNGFLLAENLRASIRKKFPARGIKYFKYRHEGEPPALLYQAWRGLGTEETAAWTRST